MPGVTVQNSGGSRNERDILVRGFDRFRVPLYMDGVRIYLPADNRLDFNRFLTPDLSEIQVAEGLRVGAQRSGRHGRRHQPRSAASRPRRSSSRAASAPCSTAISARMGQWNAYAYAGTRQKGYYAQVSGTIVDQDHFDLSSDFTPATARQYARLSGQASPTRTAATATTPTSDDWRINAKVGITPNATDEYSINYTTQAGRQAGPAAAPTARSCRAYFLGNNRRYWDWPQWDHLDPVVAVEDAARRRVLHQDERLLQHLRQHVVFYRRPDLHRRGSVDSPYDDHSVGGFVEMGTDLIPMNTLKGAIHYRRDVHWEQALNYDAGDQSSRVMALIKTAGEETWSFAVENTFHATRQLRSRYRRQLRQQQRVCGPTGLAEPLPELGKWNWQSAAIYRYSREGTVHADISSRTRFPTLFDRYSTRFGSRPEEPGLNAERATNYEVGVSDTFFKDLHVSSAIFYSDIESLHSDGFHRRQRQQLDRRLQRRRRELWP